MEEAGTSAARDGSTLATTPPGAVVLVNVDDVLAGRLTSVCAARGLAVVRADQAGAPDLDTPPTAVVASLRDEPAAAGMRALRTRWPHALLIGAAVTPDPAMWRLAQRGGADVVVNRGAVARLLGEHLDAGPERVRRFVLGDAADAAGRLGLLGTVVDTPVGAVLLVRADGAITALSDGCPHAGVALSDGDLDGTVLTCPGHGSQFDVRTGERLRGPADDPVRCWRVVEDSGQLWMML